MLARDPKISIYGPGEAGRFGFTIRSANGDVIACSFHTYSRREHATRAAKRLIGIFRGGDAPEIVQGVTR